MLVLQFIHHPILIQQHNSRSQPTTMSRLCIHDTTEPAFQRSSKHARQVSDIPNHKIVWKGKIFQISSRGHSHLGFSIPTWIEIWILFKDRFLQVENALVTGIDDDEDNDKLLFMSLSDQSRDGSMVRTMSITDDEL